MKLRIYSHFKGGVWEGEVPDVAGTHDEINERIFRLFNRVDEDDNERLEAWGYRLPSLSVGDVITHHGRTWKVDDFGFRRIPKGAFQPRHGRQVREGEGIQ